MEFSRRQIFANFIQNMRIIFRCFLFSRFLIPTKIKIAIVLLKLSPHEKINVHFKLNYVTPFTVLYNVIVSKAAIVQCKCNYKFNHTKLVYCALNYAMIFNQ